MLSVTDLEVNYHNHEALKKVSVDVCESEIVAILGSNGAGKTTLLSAICGLVEIKSGSVIFDGINIRTKTSPHKIARMGISLVPQGRWIFSDQSVLNNLHLGAYNAKDRNERKKSMDYVYDLFPVLGTRKSQLAGFLSGGEQQMLAIARGLMSNPKILLLDEPSLGLAPLVIKDIFQTIGELRTGGMMVLIVEQSVDITLNVSDRGYVIEIGRIVLAGTSSELRSNPKIIQAYLGV